jgi:hypothetical protein
VWVIDLSMYAGLNLNWAGSARWVEFIGRGEFA